MAYVIAFPHPDSFLLSFTPCPLGFFNHGVARSFINLVLPVLPVLPVMPVVQALHFIAFFENRSFSEGFSGGSSEEVSCRSCRAIHFLSLR